MQLSLGDSRIEALGAGFRLELDAKRGELVSWRVGERELLRAGPRLCAWRAPTDNDGIKLMGGQDLKPMGRWRGWGLDALAIETDDVRAGRTRDGGVRIAVRQRASAGLEHRSVTLVSPDGSVGIASVFVVPAALDDLPRLGLVLALEPGLERLVWLGRGPHESYPDRKAGARLGRFESSVSEQLVPYGMPQEHGHHTDTRWLELRDARGRGLRVEADAPFGFSASHFSAEDLFRATHLNELEPRPEVILHLDRAHRGLGTGSCGPDTLPRYRIAPGTLRFALRLRPI